VLQIDEEVEELLVVTKDNTKPAEYNVVIIGGGPSGIATALTLNALGITNCVVDANRSPSRKFGEALPPNAKPILKQLGIQALIEHEAHSKYYGNQVAWGSKQLLVKEFISEVHGSGYLLNRLLFEKQLWEYYKKQKGKIYNGFKVKKIANRACGHTISIINQNQSEFLHCDFVVDATGRKASISQKLGANKMELDSQYALTFIVNSKKTIERNIFIESTPNGWWYASPIGNNEVTVMFFTLKKLIPNKSELNMFVAKEMKASLHMRKFLNDFLLNNATIRIIPAGSSRLEKSYGSNWIAVGDAACAFDPISSYGITSALASGYYAAQAIASTLAGKQEAMLTYRYIIENACQAYSKKLINHYEKERQWPESYYWQNRFALMKS
jgi:flavin-dependent dehydrogenase